MVLQQLLFANLHFTISVIGVLVFLATALLYFDSWKVSTKKKTPLLRSIGFFFLAGSAALHATSLDLPSLLFSLQLMKIMGLGFILISLAKEPVLHKPVHNIILVPLPFALLQSSLMPLSAVLYLLIALTYFRKASEGLERQLRPAGFAFILLAINELMNISFFWKDTPVVYLSQLLAEYGIISITSHLLELTGLIILGIWTWGYIRFRLQIQLFTATIAMSFMIFVITTFFFTFLLLRNIEDNTLSSLKVDVNVMHYALERLQAEALADARSIAQDTGVKDAINKNDDESLYQKTSSIMLSQNTSFLQIVSPTGEVIMRAEDRDSVGDNQKDDAVVKSAMGGKQLATVIKRDGTLAPLVQVKAAVPIPGGSGVVVTGFSVDNAFVDGVKDITELDVAVFGNDTRAATTFVAADSKSRFVGTKETNEKILQTVLRDKKNFAGTAQILNQPYYTVYSPIKTLDDKVIGMLFVGKLQTTLIDTAKKSIELTFLGSILLMILSVVPAYFLAKYMQEHAEA